jgi:hypothetical protein
MNINLSFATPLRVIHVPFEQAQQQYPPVFTIQYQTFTVRGENMAASMGVGTYATVSVEWKDKGGNVVGVEQGSVKWASSDEDVCQVEPSTGNPQIANLYAPGGIGTVQIQSTGDADLGEGVKPVTASIDVQVVGGQAVGGEITFTQSPAQGNPPSGKK